MSLFVTGTGTDIGKTHIACGMLRTRPVRALKPVMSGYDPLYPGQSDAGRLLAARGIEVNAEAIAAISPWRFAAPLSPDMAAAREGRAIDFDALVDFCRADEPVLVEGVGGVMVPLDERHTVADWIAALGMPVLLVGGSYLGALSHMLSALAALRGARIAAVVVNETPGSSVGLAETVASLRNFCAAPLHVIARDGAAEYAALADLI